MIEFLVTVGYVLAGVVLFGWMVPATVFLLLLPRGESQPTDHRTGDRTGHPVYA